MPKKNTLIKVQDFGEGIPEESLRYVFDNFFRADTARNRKSGGAGIGLSLAQALVKLHGGTITVESTVGEGTTFTISLPDNRESFDKQKQRPKGIAPLIK